MSLDAGFWSCPLHDPKNQAPLDSSFTFTDSPALPKNPAELWLRWVLCHRCYLCHSLRRRIPRRTGPAENLASRDDSKLNQDSICFFFFLKTLLNESLHLFQGTRPRPIGKPSPCAENDKIDVLATGASLFMGNYLPLLQKLLQAHKVVLNSPSPFNKNTHPLIFLRGWTHQKSESVNTQWREVI